ncbi:MAG: sensor histidine kinase, partial [Polyangiales bacterium]
LARAKAAARSAEAALDQARASAGAREKLFDAVVDTAPMAIVLLGDRGRIAFTNREARELFFEGKDPGAADFLALLADAPETLRRAVLADRDELVTTDEDGEREVWAIAKRHLEGETGPQTLLLVKHLTPEMNRQEVETWRRIIRVMSHELNNSLAPISSLMHSARLLAKGTPQEPKLGRVFDTVSERADHLRAFLEGYASLARLPKPRPREVEWAPLLERVRTMHPEVKIDDAPGAGWFDPTQMEQVIINLLKNAVEAGGDAKDVELAVFPGDGGGARVVVRDRGRGLTEEVLANALLPFYSTKEGGSGIGLAICREVLEAHGGRLRIKNREGGGAEVAIRLPGPTAEGHRAKLTLTRA